MELPLDATNLEGRNHYKYFQKLCEFDSLAYFISNSVNHVPMYSNQICPALAMGNTVVLKPATVTRLSALLLAEICHEAGLPKG